jgi:hypothetical protein
MSRGFRDMGLPQTLRDPSLRTRQRHAFADFHLEHFDSSNAGLGNLPHFSKPARSGAPVIYGVYIRDILGRRNWALAWCVNTQMIEYAAQLHKLVTGTR